VTHPLSFWHSGHHDNPFGIRLSALMISKGIADPSVPMSLLADHPDVHYRSGIPVSSMSLRPDAHSPIW
jgi:glucosamine-6-phosphate deaminase